MSLGKPLCFICEMWIIVVGVVCEYVSDSEQQIQIFRRVSDNKEGVKKQ